MLAIPMILAAAFTTGSALHLEAKKAEHLTQITYVKTTKRTTQRLLVNGHWITRVRTITKVKTTI